MRLLSFLCVESIPSVAGCSMNHRGGLSYHTQDKTLLAKMFFVLRIFNGVAKGATDCTGENLR